MHEFHRPLPPGMGEDHKRLPLFLFQLERHGGVHPVLGSLDAFPFDQFVRFQVRHFHLAEAEIDGSSRPLLSFGDTVQVLDVTDGGIHALLRLHVRQPTRFLYDFHFFHNTADARIAALRAEFSDDLARARPAAVVVFRESWLRRGYERLADLPPVARLLDRDYRLAVSAPDDAYRIYARRARP